MKFGKFGVLGSSLAVSALLAGSTAMFAADMIPYPTPGVIAPSVPIFASGTSTVFYFGFNASDGDYIDIYDINKGTQTGYIFPNQSSPIGSSVALATSTGDLLVVEVIDTNKGDAFYSGTGATPVGTFSCVGPAAACALAPTTPMATADGLNHGYVTTYSGGTVGGVTVGAGLFIGMEDLDRAQNSDFDYNDDQFILTGVQTTPPTAVTPEPGSIALLGTGILGAAGMIRRRITA